MTWVILIFLILLKFPKKGLGIKCETPPCRCEFKPGDSRCSGPQVVTQPFTTFSLFFSLCLIVLIHPVPLVKPNLRSDIIEILSLEHSGRTRVGAGCFMSPLYRLVRVLPKLSRQLDRSSEVVPFIGLPTLGAIKSVHSRCSALPFSLSLILPGTDGR